MRAAVLLAALTVAHGGGWRTYSDAAAGFSLAVPGSWRVVPRADAALAALERRLQQRKQLALANELAVVAAERRRVKTTFAFQALQWPAPAGPTVPDVAVRTEPLTAHTTAAALPTIARQYAKALAGAKGATLQPLAQVRLPAGRAARITGSTPLGRAKLRSGFVVYLLVHGPRLYSIAFRGSAAQTVSEAPLFARVAATLRFR